MNNKQIFMPCGDRIRGLLNVGGEEILFTSLVLSSFTCKKGQMRGIIVLFSQHSLTLKTFELQLAVYVIMSPKWQR